MSNILDGTVLINVYVQPVWLEIHSLHRVGPEDAVLLWEIGLCERLAISLNSLVAQSKHVNSYQHV